VLLHLDLSGIQTHNISGEIKIKHLRFLYVIRGL
jgi:hypothetical protein